MSAWRGWRPPAAALAFVCVLVSGCASLAPQTVRGRPTALMAEVGARRSAIDLRQRVDALVPALMAAIELTADRVRSTASDPVIRRRALRFKIDLVPIIYEAGLRPDPLTAGLDLWLLSYQVELCLEAGTGLCDFGPHQAVALAAARQQRVSLDRAIEEVSLNREALVWERQLVRDTARRHPLPSDISLRQRSAITTELAGAIRVETLSPFELLGDVSATLTSLSSRLSLYIEEASRLARWQAEWLAEDVAGWPTVDRALGDVGRMSASVERLSHTLDPDSLTRLAERPIGLLREERLTTMAEIDRQRALTLRYLSAEGALMVDTLLADATTALASERAALVANLRNERLETLAEVEALRRRLIVDGSAEAQRLVDHVVWRLVQLVGLAVVLAAIPIWMSKRDTGGPALPR